MKQARLAAERRRSRSKLEGPPQIIKIEDLVKKEKEAAEVEKKEEVEVDKKIYGDVITKKENKKDVVDEPLLPILYKRHARLASARRRSSTGGSSPGEERVVVDTEGRKSMTHIKEHPKDFPAMAQLIENIVQHSVVETTTAVNESRPATTVPRPALRFQVQDRVDCNIDNRCWKRGTIMELWYQGPHKHVMPYAIQLDNGAITYAPSDDDRAIRRARAPEEDAFSAKEALKDAAALKTAAAAAAATNVASTKEDDDTAADKGTASTKDEDATDKGTASTKDDAAVKHTVKHTLYQHTATDTDVEWCLDAVECGEDGPADESSGTDETHIDESDEEDDGDVVVNNNNDDDDDTEDDAPPLLLSKHNPTVVIPVMASHLEMDLTHQRLEATHDYSSLSLPHDQIKIQLSSCAQQLPLQQPPTVGDAQLQDPDQQQKHLISLENGPLHPLPSSSSTTTTPTTTNDKCAVVASQQQQQPSPPNDNKTTECDCQTCRYDRLRAAQQHSGRLPLTTVHHTSRQQQQHQSNNLEDSPSTLPYQPRQNCDQVHPCQNCRRRRLQDLRERKQRQLKEDAEAVRQAALPPEISLQDLFGNIFDIADTDPYVVAAEAKRALATSGLSPAAQEAAALTKAHLSTEQVTSINSVIGLQGYPQSPYFAIGYRLFHDTEFFTKRKSKEVSVEAFYKGALQGCVPCIFYYVDVQYCIRRNVHLAIPWALEGAIRGQVDCMQRLVFCYCNTKSSQTHALASFWAKFQYEMGFRKYANNQRKQIKQDIGARCFVCEQQDLPDNDVTLVKCGRCKYYSYCGKACQLQHWKDENHIGECRLLKTLREYCKPRYIQEICDALHQNIDPKEIPRLQTLRQKLGLTRPTSDYQELVERLSDPTLKGERGKSPNRYEYCTARRDGTVHIGSTPQII